MSNKATPNPTTSPELQFKNIFFFLCPTAFLCRTAVGREGQKVLRNGYCDSTQVLERNLILRLRNSCILLQILARDDFGHLLA